MGSLRGKIQRETEVEQKMAEEMGGNGEVTKIESLQKKRREKNK